MFDLPTGFSVSSQSGAIRDNLYMPSLSIERTGNSPSVSWPDADQVFVLQSADSLALPINWITETNVTSQAGKRVHVPDPGASVRFYRLKY